VDNRFSFSIADGCDPDNFHFLFAIDSLEYRLLSQPAQLIVQTSQYALDLSTL
jgi:hypothetical protein